MWRQDENRMLRVAGVMAKAANDRSFANLYLALTTFIEVMQDAWAEMMVNIHGIKADLNNHRHCPRCDTIILVNKETISIPETNRCPTCGWLHVINPDGTIKDDSESDPLKESSD